MPLSNFISDGETVLRAEYFACECNAYDHSIRFQFDPTEDDIRFSEIWVDTAFPPEASLWRRIKLAAKYVWTGRGTEYTTGSWILMHKDYKRLRNFLLEYDTCVWKLENKPKKKGTPDIEYGPGGLG